MLIKIREQMRWGRLINNFLPPLHLAIKGGQKFLIKEASFP